MVRKAKEVNPDPDNQQPATTATGSDLQPQPELVTKGKAKAEKSQLPEWRLEQLRKAGKARGEQLKRDKAHQSKAGKALVAQRGPDYMEKIGSAGHDKALADNPDLQTKAAKAGKGKPKPRKKQRAIKPDGNQPAQEGNKDE